MRRCRVNQPDCQVHFEPAPSRLVGEREERLARAARRLRYHFSFLDDCLRGIGPNDLVLLGAETGAGKTDLVTAIAKANARARKRVYYFALEAEPKEIERRAKYAFIVELALKASDPRAVELNYIDWITGAVDGVARRYDQEANQLVLEQLASLHTYYRGRAFGLDNIEREFRTIRNAADLIVLDHLHYVDIDDDASENRAYKQIVQTIRALAIELGVPVILVAHLRKRNLSARQLVPHVEDFHGSSDLIKVATHCIQIAPARAIEAPKWWLSPTFVHVPKDRHGGANGFVAVCMFDRRHRRYDESYTLGRLSDGGTKWEPLKPNDVPAWARNNRTVQS